MIIIIVHENSLICQAFCHIYGIFTDIQINIISLENACLITVWAYLES